MKVINGARSDLNLAPLRGEVEIMWHSWKVYNNGLANEREFKRVIEGKYQVETQDTYTPESFYQKIVKYEESEITAIQNRMNRRERRFNQIQELKNGT